MLYLEDACGTAAYATGNYDVTLSDPSQPVGIGLGRSPGYSRDMYCTMLFMTSAYKCQCAVQVGETARAWCALC